MAAKYDDIAEFAELGDFMDMPMRTYSSGMYGRLAFSVAINMDPDILLIDEALSAGDARFKEKSFEKMRELCEQARTIVLVSHGLRSVRELCSEVIWLHKGQVAMRDDAESVIDAYTGSWTWARARSRSRTSEAGAAASIIPGWFRSPNP